MGVWEKRETKRQLLRCQEVISYHPREMKPPAPRDGRDRQALASKRLQEPEQRGPVGGGQVAEDLPCRVGLAAVPEDRFAQRAGPAVVQVGFAAAGTTPVSSARPRPAAVRCASASNSNRSAACSG